MGFYLCLKMMNIFKCYQRQFKIPYQVVNYDEFLQNPKPKLIINCKPEDMDKIIERSKTFHSDEFKSSSHKTASVLYEYMDPRVSKTAGLIEILKLHHIDIKVNCDFWRC